MTAATALRATALPMPAVSVTPALRTFGRSNCRRRLIEVIVGAEVMHLGPESGKVYLACWKCAGTGTVTHYAHVFEGLCFQCNGAGLATFAANIEAAQRKVRSAEAKAIRAQAKADQAAAEYAAALPAIIEAAYIAALAEDDQRNAAAAAKAAVEAAQTYAGNVGDKIVFTGTVAVTFACESQYGTRYLVVIEGTGDNAGQTVKTIGTADFHYDAERGQNVTIKATVKEHYVYNGTKQTVVIRPKAA